MRRGRQHQYYYPVPSNMNQLWQMCMPHNPNALRFPLLINRSCQTNNRIWQEHPHYHHARSQSRGRTVSPRCLSGNRRSVMDQTSQDQEEGELHSASSSSSHNLSTTSRWDNSSRRLGSTYSEQKVFRYGSYPDVYDESRRQFNVGSQTQLYADLNVGHATKSPVTNIDNSECNVDLLYERLQYLRQWEPVSSQPINKDGQEFSIMSYNVLAQCLLESNCELYEHCNPNILDWDYRKERLLKELKQSNADVICLQEVQEDHYNDFFLPNMKNLDYDGIYKKRTGEKNDGCAIFYKVSSFALDSWQAVEFKRPCVELLDRDNVGIVALLRPLNNENITDDQLRVCVATTHLLFNPKRGDIKLAQLQLLFAEVDRLSRRNSSSTHPVIICGDMNSEPHCQIYKFLHTGRIHYEGLPVATLSGQIDNVGRGFQRYLPSELLPPSLGVTDYCQYASQNSNGQKLEEAEEMGGCSNSSAENNDDYQNLFSTGYMAHNLNLLSVYGHLSKRMPGYSEITTQHSKAACTVDYIFYSVKKKDICFSRPKVKHQHIKESNLKLLATYSLLTDEEVRNFGGLPNCVSPSDHLPLMAKFLLSS